MKKHINFPKISQFRNIVLAVNKKTAYTDIDEDGVDKPPTPKPIIKFKGTVKIHGTNASVCFNAVDGLWVQSRQNIITTSDDNNGFAFFVTENLGAFYECINKIIAENNLDTNIYTVSIHGEWAGKGIQKNVGISKLEKAFYIFGVKVSKPQDEDFVPYWVDSSNIRNKEYKIFNLNDFETYSIEVDFNVPELSQNVLSEVTKKVEKECPVAKYFGIDNGIGEGVVWCAEYRGDFYIFKVKGDKHSVTRVKKLADVDVEKIENIKEFIEYSVTENRFNQAIENVFGKNELDVKELGNLIRWVIKDIMLEEMDTMASNKLKPQEVNKYISAKVRKMFFEVY